MRIGPRRVVSAWPRIFKAALACVLSVAVGNLAWAHSPASVRLLVGFSAGGGTDTAARLLAEHLRQELEVPVLVDNRPGAGGQIAAMALKSAPPNGTVLFVTNDHTISVLPQMLQNPGFDPARDFTPVAGFASYVSVFALSAAVPPRSFREYLAWLRKNGGKGNVGIPAPASVPEFLVRAVADRTGLDLVAAPYRGAAPMLADLMAGQIPAGVAAVNDVVEAHNADKLRVVAVAGPARQAALPQVPTFTELGLSGFEDSGYYGIYAPAGTPPATVQRLSDAVRRVLEQPRVRERMAAMGLTVDYLTHPQMAAREHAYTQALGRLIESGGFRPR